MVLENESSFCQVLFLYLDNPNAKNICSFQCLITIKIKLENKHIFLLWLHFTWTSLFIYLFYSQKLHLTHKNMIHFNIYIEIKSGGKNLKVFFIFFILIIIII